MGREAIRSISSSSSSICKAQAELSSLHLGIPKPYIPALRAPSLYSTTGRRRKDRGNQSTADLAGSGEQALHSKWCGGWHVLCQDAFVSYCSNLYLNGASRLSALILIQGNKKQGGNMEQWLQKWTESKQHCGYFYIDSLLNPNH